MFTRGHYAADNVCYRRASTISYIKRPSSALADPLMADEAQIEREIAQTRARSAACSPAAKHFTAAAHTWGVRKRRFSCIFRLISLSARAALNI